jgi:chromosome segregation ATPase
VGPDGLCDNCVALVKFEQDRDAVIQQTDKLKTALADEQALYDALAERAKADALQEIQGQIDDLVVKKDELVAQTTTCLGELSGVQTELDKTQKSVTTAERKLQTLRQLIKSAQYAREQFDAEISDVPGQLAEDIERELSPTVKLNLQCMDVRELRKAFTQNQKAIKETYEKYKARYTTKTNMAIYQLMTIALEAELQNVLHGIGYGKLDKAIADIQEIIAKYYKIAADGNQSIASTIKKYVGEMEYFFVEAVKIEYEYYVQRERAKEEQRAIREQMRQEAEERRELERQQKQMEKEEAKYKTEIDSVQQMLAAEQDDEKVKALQARIEKLQQQLEATATQRDEIIKRQNGKAGNVYIISNIGSFGEDVFKIGMTRRMDPQERIDELGDASVPFPFDVHSFIFSDNAVDLETDLHHRLNDRRVNKVNLRKEFFRVSLDELEELVYSLEPTAEFKRTILATQFRQSLSIDEVPENVELIDIADDE